MNSFSSDYLRQMSSNNTQLDFSNNVPYTNSHTWNSHYSISDISLISRDEGESTICGSDGQPLCRELNFCDLPEDIRCMYEVAKCGMPIANSFQDEQDYMMMMMQNSASMDQTPVFYGSKNCVQQRFESYDTPTWEEFKSSVDDASSGRWEENVVVDDGEKLYQELMNESFKYVAVVKAPQQQQPPSETDQEPDVVPESVTVSENTVLSSLEQDTVRSVVRDCTAVADQVVKKTESWSKKISEFLQLTLLMILSFLIFVVLPMSPMFFFEPGSLYRRYEFVGDFHR